MNVVIIGSTGMVGKGVLLECLESQAVESVLIINREPVNISHAKLTEIINADFSDLSTIKEHLKGYDACFYCLGISSSGVSETVYRNVTYDLTMNFANTLLELNPSLTFCYVSASGADSTGKSSTAWARIKGETENALFDLPFKNAYMFRPALIQPLKGTESKTKSYKIMYKLLTPFNPLFKHFPKFATTTEKIGLAMINVVNNGSNKPILESIDINNAS